MSLDLSRRSFLKMAGVLGAAATGCTGEVPARKLMPYVIPDENVVPGMPAFYAGLCTECTAGCGIVARVREGRVTKLEGNPADPTSRGALCARGQAALHALYNPDRLPEPRARSGDGSTAALTWDEALARLVARLDAAAAAGSERIAIVTPPAGPTLERIVNAWLGTWGSSRWLRYEPLDEAAARDATERCFGRRDLPHLRIDTAEVVVSFGAEFLETWRSPVEYTHQYAAFRVPHGPERTSVGRLVYVGPRFGLTAANGDEWIATAPGQETAVALGVLSAVLDAGAEGGGIDVAALRRFLAGWGPEDVAGRTGVPAATMRRVAGWLTEAKGGALAIAGTEDATAHLAAYLLDAVTGNLGRTVQFFDGARPAPEDGPAEAAAFVDAMRRGEIDVLVIAGTNPAFTLSPAVGFADAVARVPFVAWAGIVPDETAALAHLLLPIDHTLETWGDALPRPGVAVLGQPVMQPVYATLPLGDVLLATARREAGPLPWASTRAAVEATWQEMHAARKDGTPFAAFWEEARRRGGLFTEVPPAAVALLPEALGQPLAPPAVAPEQPVVVGFPHLLLYDGRGADKPWLQEIPEPVTQLCWDSWIALHPVTASRMGLRKGDVLELSSAHGTIAAAAYPTPHVHPAALAVPFGQGHTTYGRYASGRGGNPWRLLPLGARSIGVSVRPTGTHRDFVTWQYGLETTLGRPLAEAISLEDLARGVTPRYHAPEPSTPYELRPRSEYPRHQWGMTIDLAACTGCSACVAACYAENNVGVVGPANIARGGVMSWLRIERFVPQSANEPLLHLLPMLCQQCDRAPCEPVCPVYASEHTSDGLNAQVYNRCIGTRYCNNNCPYKVRRFNWFPARWWDSPLELQLNPDVTVRSQGVMEKCTFCVQRIRLAEENAKEEDRPVRDLEIETACMQACPADAITFGDMKDAESAMMRRRRDHRVRSYRALDDLNTAPAIVYLQEVYRSREET